MKKVFIDCGANVGQSAKAWLSCIPESEHEEWEIHCFEASKKPFQKLMKKSTELLRQFNGSEKNITCYNKAVWINDLGVKFYDLGNQSSSTHSEKQGMAFADARIVESVDLSDFIQSFDINDHIVLKMDIEGGEYEVVPHLYETGAMEYINAAFMEFHSTKIKGVSIEEDFAILEMFNGEGIELHHWSAEYTKANTNPYDRIITKKGIIKDWRRKNALSQEEAEKYEK